MQARRKLASGQKDAKTFPERLCERPVCACYRHDGRRKRGATVEIIVEESGWAPPEKLALAGLRVELRETELQRRIKQASGKWSSAKRVWEIHYNQAVALGLKKRIVKLEVSDIRHHRQWDSSSWAALPVATTSDSR